MRPRAGPPRTLPRVTRRRSWPKLVGRPPVGSQRAWPPASLWRVGSHRSNSTAPGLRGELTGSRWDGATVRDRTDSPLWDLDGPTSGSPAGRPLTGARSAIEGSRSIRNIASRRYPVRLASLFLAHATGSRPGGATAWAIARRRPAGPERRPRYRSRRARRSRGLQSRADRRRRRRWGCGSAPSVRVAFQEAGRAAGRARRCARPASSRRELR
jgi:hypothetical protein